jgi:hypothetical protein
MGVVWCMERYGETFVFTLASLTVVGICVHSFDPYFVSKKKARNSPVTLRFRKKPEDGSCMWPQNIGYVNFVDSDALEAGEEEFMKSLSLEVDIKFHTLALEFIPFIRRVIRLIM